MEQQQEKDHAEYLYAPFNCQKRDRQIVGHIPMHDIDHAKLCKLGKCDPRDEAGANGNNCNNQRFPQEKPCNISFAHAENVI